MSKGELIILTSGEYSDYYLIGVFKVLVDFDPAKLIGNYLASASKIKPNGDLRFCFWLVANGYIEDTQCREWHVGSYGAIDGLPKPIKKHELLND